MEEYCSRIAREMLVALQRAPPIAYVTKTGGATAGCALMLAERTNRKTQVVADCHVVALPDTEQL